MGAPTLSLDVTIVGGGMITFDLLLPSFYHLERTGVVRKIDICALNTVRLKALAENSEFCEAFPGQRFTPHPSFSAPSGERYPELYGGHCGDGSGQYSGSGSTRRSTLPSNKIRTGARPKRIVC